MDKTEIKLEKWQKGIEKSPEFGFLAEFAKKFPQAQIYLVGGAVRDIILDRETKDYDFVIAKVEAKELDKFLSGLGKVDLVGKSFGVFKFVPEIAGFEEKIEAFDVALPRTEIAGMSGGYKDFDVQSDPNLPIEDDLGRRDFTINALAWDIRNQKLIDQFDGVDDLKNKIIRAIGEAEKRFQEDYTRMLRAIRFSCQLDFKIEPETLKVISLKTAKIKTIAVERINEEFSKIIMSPKAEEGIRLLAEIGLLNELIPELASSRGVTQNKHHIYDVFEHSVRALGAGAERDYKLEVRLAALLHDIGKPETKEGEGLDATFYNHDIVGAKIAKKILKRLSFSNDVIDYTVHLIRYHMFYYALDIVSDAGVRRMLARLGKENIDDFIAVRICDRLGMGRPKAKPWKLIELERRFKEVQLDPITPKMIALKGDELMQLLKIKPGPRVGLLLNAMLGEVLDDPKLNDHEYLVNRVKKLDKLDDKELRQMNPDVKFFEEERKRNLHREK
ncbi:MAG: HD domain-containing protein [Candidatus Buchananbacteria bacterium]|jgi:poly(A) polymerase/tRNA nucleotidyltransferase (CCA-adding enzyme)